MKTVYSHNRKFESEKCWDCYNDTPGAVTMNPKGGTTVAMEVIQSWLLDTIQQGDTIVRKVGIAKCSDDDNFCRKTGREIAQSRLKQTTLTAINIVKVRETVIVFFEDQSGNMFEVKKSADPQCARLVRMLDDNE